MDEHLSDLWRRRQDILVRLNALEGRARDFDSRANFFVQKASDWISGTATHRLEFRRTLRLAEAALNSAAKSLAEGTGVDWEEAHTFLESAERQLLSAGDFWRKYMKATAGGAESIVQGLRVIRNASFAFSATGGVALASGATMAMAGAWAASAGAHAGFFSLSLTDERRPIPAESVTLEIAEVEVVDTEGETSRPLVSESDSSSTASPPAARLREGKRSKRNRSARRLETVERKEADTGAELNRTPGVLTMRDKSIPLDAAPEPSDIYPSQEMLDDIIDVSPKRPQAVVQDATGSYRRYEDGSTLVRNPELGPYPLAQEVEVEEGITVMKDGRVEGDLETEQKPNIAWITGREDPTLFFMEHVAHNAGFGAGNGRMKGGVADIVIAIDVSRSMQEAAGLVRKSLAKILKLLHSRGAKEVRVGIVVFRDHPLIYSPLYKGDADSYRGVEVLDEPGRLTPERITEIEAKLERMEFNGAAEPLGLAVRRSVFMLEQLPPVPGLHSQQVVVVSDHEGSETQCGDRSYPADDRYTATRKEAARKGITTSLILIPNGIGCGCSARNCIQG